MRIFTERTFGHQDVKNLPYGTEFQLFLSSNLLPVFDMESGISLTEAEYEENTKIYTFDPNRGLENPSVPANECFAVISECVSDEVALSKYINDATYDELFPNSDKCNLIVW
jgi:hypothetical protein